MTDTEEKQETTVNPFYSKLCSELKCGVCLKTVVDPRVLSCPHTFCTTCLRSWYFACLKNALAASAHGHRHPVVKYQDGIKDFYLQCPTCRSKTKVDPELDCLGLNRNIALSNMVSLTRRHEYMDTKGKVSCDICGCNDIDTTPVQLCAKCSLRLCSECLHNYHTHTVDQACSGMFFLKSNDVSHGVVHITQGAVVPFCITPAQALERLSSRLRRKVKLRAVWAQMSLRRVRVSAKFEGTIHGTAIQGKCRELVLVKTILCPELTPAAHKALITEMANMSQVVVFKEGHYERGLAEIHHTRDSNATPTPPPTTDDAGDTRGEEEEGSNDIQGNVETGEGAEGEEREEREEADADGDTDAGARATVRAAGMEQPPFETLAVGDVDTSDQDTEDLIHSAIRAFVRKQYNLSERESEYFIPTVLRSRQKVKKELKIWVPVYVARTPSKGKNRSSARPAVPIPAARATPTSTNATSTAADATTTTTTTTSTTTAATAATTPTAATTTTITTTTATTTTDIMLPYDVVVHGVTGKVTHGGKSSGRSLMGPPRRKRLAVQVARAVDVIQSVFINAFFILFLGVLAARLFHTVV